MATLPPIEDLQADFDRHKPLLYVGVLKEWRGSCDTVLQRCGTTDAQLREVVAQTRARFCESKHLLEHCLEAVAERLGGDEETAHRFMILESVHANADNQSVLSPPYPRQRPAG